MSRPPRDDIDWDAVRFGFENGDTLAVLASAAGCSITTVRNRAEAEGWSRPSTHTAPQRRPDIDWEEVRAAYEAGETLAGLAQRFNLNRGSIRHRAEREAWQRGRVVQASKGGRPKADDADAIPDWAEPRLKGYPRDYRTLTAAQWIAELKAQAGAE
ncbi:MAG TPA: hypothetical protein VD978_20325 [Azospirillum sp.]|nr:hypothetical protein [Azospirillum sp.]